MKKKTALLLVLVLTAALLGGCGGSKAKAYTQYVQGVMDCSYYGKFEDYLKSRGGEAEEAEAQEVYDSTAENLAYNIMYYVDIDYEIIGDAVIEKYVALAKEVLAKAKFQVNDAEEAGDSYHVKIEIEPMDFFEIIYEPAVDFLDDFNTTVDAEKDYTDDELAALEEQYAGGMLEAIKPCAAKIGYGDTVSKIVEITVDDEGYGLADEDWLEIDDLVSGWE